MKKRFSDKQIISFLREAEAGVSDRELCSLIFTLFIVCRFNPAAEF